MLSRRIDTTLGHGNDVPSPVLHIHITAHFSEPCSWVPPTRRLHFLWKQLCQRYSLCRHAYISLRFIWHWLCSWEVFLSNVLR